MGLGVRVGVGCGASVEADVHDGSRAVGVREFFAWGIVVVGGVEAVNAKNPHPMRKQDEMNIEARARTGVLSMFPFP
jgi:hypothetical protein